MKSAREIGPDKKLQDAIWAKRDLLSDTKEEDLFHAHQVILIGEGSIIVMIEMNVDTIKEEIIQDLVPKKEDTDQKGVVILEIARPADDTWREHDKKIKNTFESNKYFSNTKTKNNLSKLSKFYIQILHPNSTLIYATKTFKFIIPI